MALSRNEINALNVLNLRKLTFIPEHFSKVTIEHKFDRKAVECWIEYNLNSRYAITNSYKLNEERKLISVVEIGLEDPKEITLLTLGCNHLHKK